MIQQILHLIDIGCPLGVYIHLLHQENVGLSLIDLQNQRFHIDEHFFFAHQAPLSPTLKEELNTRTAVLNIIRHDLK